MKNRKKATVLKVAMALAVLLMLAACIAPVSAINDTFPSYQHIYLGVANDGGVRFNEVGNNTYYYNFSKPTGGLKSIHITDSNNTEDRMGDEYTNQAASGTFYVSETSTDTHYHDDVILMFAVPSSANITNLGLQINAAGYQWDPTGDGSEPEDPDYNATTLSESFASGDFLSGTSAWRPAPTADYPVYYGQNVSLNDQFKFMLIDLNAGSLNQTNLDYNNGSVQVAYTLTGYTGNAYFDAYAWCNQSKQGQGVSWTNKLVDPDDSGWAINIA
jgi:hypothetical protein